jgi:hypothetical protein
MIISYLFALEAWFVVDLDLEPSRGVLDVQLGEATKIAIWVGAMTKG